MNTTEIKAGKIRQQRSEEAAVVVPRTNFCLPLLDTGIIKISRREEPGSAGYAPAATVIDVTEQMEEQSSALGSYNDFIHYNYGAASQRYYPLSGNSEPE